MGHTYPSGHPKTIKPCVLTQQETWRQGPPLTKSRVRILATVPRTCLCAEDSTAKPSLLLMDRLKNSWSVVSLLKQCIWAVPSQHCSYSWWSGWLLSALRRKREVLKTQVWGLSSSWPILPYSMFILLQNVLVYLRETISYWNAYVSVLTAHKNMSHTCISHFWASGLKMPQILLGLIWPFHLKFMRGIVVIFSYWSPSFQQKMMARI